MIPYKKQPRLANAEVAFYFVSEINHLYGDFFSLQANVFLTKKV